MPFSASASFMRSVPRRSPSVSLAYSRHLLAEHGRAVMGAQDALNMALIAVADMDMAFNAGHLDRDSRDRKRADLRLDALLDVVLRTEAEHLVLEEIYTRAGSFAMDRVIGYHVRRSLATTEVLPADRACRDDLLVMAQAVRVYLEDDQSDFQDMVIRAAWESLRRHIRPIRAG